jgi:hypothetical protein
MSMTINNRVPNCLSFVPSKTKWILTISMIRCRSKSVETFGEVRAALRKTLAVADGKKRSRRTSSNAILKQVHC